MQFTAKTYLFGPVAQTSDGLIKKVIVDKYSGTDTSTAKREMRYTVVPDPILWMQVRITVQQDKLTFKS